MKLWTLAACAVVAGCTPRMLERAALRDEAKAQARAQRGDGEDAARLLRRAEARRATAQVRAERHGRLWAEWALE